MKESNVVKSSLPKIKVLMCVVERGMGNSVSKLCQPFTSGHQTVLLGYGTAKDEVLRTLQLDHLEKDVVLSLILEDYVPAVLYRLKEELSLKKRGTGVACVVPINGMSKTTFDHVVAIEEKLTATEKEEIMQKRDKAMQQIQQNEKEQTGMTATEKTDLILTIVNRGFADEVMDAAREAGAAGGTVLHARGTGEEEEAKFLGIVLHPEKEVVMTLVPHSIRQDVIQSVSKVAGLTTAGNGISFSLPVDEVEGVSHNGWRE